MCGRGTQTESASQKLKLHREIPDLFIQDPGLPSRYNISPAQQLLVVRQTATGFEGVPTRWGLVPYWWRDPEKLPDQTFNARSETVLEKVSFKVPFRRRRCLIAMDGWYEWKELSKTEKQPYYIHPKDPDEVFAFAGLWDTWKGPDGALESCTMMTTVANELVAKIHAKKRMPVILDPKDWQSWLDPKNQEVEHLMALQVPWDQEKMAAHPVRPIRGDGPGLIQPLVA